LPIKRRDALLCVSTGNARRWALPTLQRVKFLVKLSKGKTQFVPKLGTNGTACMLHRYKKIPCIIIIYKLFIYNEILEKNVTLSVFDVKENLKIFV